MAAEDETEDTSNKQADVKAVTQQPRVDHNNSSPGKANGQSSSAIPLGPSSSPTTTQPIALGPPPAYTPSSPTRSSPTEKTDLNPAGSPKHYNSTSNNHT